MAILAAFVADVADDRCADITIYLFPDLSVRNCHQLGGKIIFQLESTDQSTYSRAHKYRLDQEHVRAPTLMRSAPLCLSSGPSENSESTSTPFCVRLHWCRKRFAAPVCSARKLLAQSASARKSTSRGGPNFGSSLWSW